MNKKHTIIVLMIIFLVGCNMKIKPTNIAIKTTNVTTSNITSKKVETQKETISVQSNGEKIQVNPDKDTFNTEYKKQNNPLFFEFNQEGITYEFLGFYWDSGEEFPPEYNEYNEDGDICVQVKVTVTERQRYENVSIVEVNYDLYSIGTKELVDEYNDWYYITEDKIYGIVYEDHILVREPKTPPNNLVGVMEEIVISDEVHNQQIITINDDKCEYKYFNEGNSSGEKMVWKDQEGLVFHSMNLGAHGYGFRLYRNTMWISENWKSKLENEDFISDNRIEGIDFNSFVEENNIVFEDEWMNDEHYSLSLMQACLVDVNSDGNEELYLVERNGSGWFYQTKVMEAVGDVYKKLASTSAGVYLYEVDGEFHYIELNYNYGSKWYHGFTEYMLIENSWFPYATIGFDYVYDNDELSEKIKMVIDSDWLQNYENFELYESNIGKYNDKNEYIVEDADRGIKYKFKLDCLHTSVGHHPTIWTLDVANDEMKSTSGVNDFVANKEGLFFAGLAFKQLDSGEIYAVKLSLQSFGEEDELDTGDFLVELYELTPEGIIKVEEMIAHGEEDDYVHGDVRVINK